jgi:hypothetical protein
VQELLGNPTRFRVDGSDAGVAEVRLATHSFDLTHALDAIEDGVAYFLQISDLLRLSTAHCGIVAEMRRGPPGGSGEP